MSKLTSALVAGVFCLAASAEAQVSRNVEWSKRNDGWAKVQISPGCHLIWFGDHRVYRQIDNITPDDRVDVVVRGSCNANGLAEGPIRIETTVHFPPTSVADEAEYHYLGWRTVREGNARNGLLQGMVKMWDYERVQGKPDVWELTGFPEGLHNYFQDGCEYFDDGNGGPDLGRPVTEHSHWGQCDPEGGRQLLADMGNAGGGAQPAPVASPTARLLPAAPPANPAQTAGTDVWSRCITVTQYPPDGGIQTVWALNNTCNTTVIARFCFRAQHEAAGDPNLCRRREMRTQEIRPGGKYDFPFTLIAPGSSLTDGRIVRSNELLVSGFACTGGNFPDAYFDSDGSFNSNGC